MQYVALQGLFLMHVSLHLCNQFRTESVLRIGTGWSPTKQDRVVFWRTHGIKSLPAYFTGRGLLGKVEALTEALQELPVVRKLDLRGNDALTTKVRRDF